MDRTGFLRTLGVVVAGSALCKAPLLASPLEPHMAASGARQPEFRWAHDEILASADAGRTWKQHARFGTGFEVMSVYRKDGEVLADVLFKRQHRFLLRLNATGTAWLLHQE